MRENNYIFDSQAVEMLHTRCAYSTAFSTYLNFINNNVTDSEDEVSKRYVNLIWRIIRQFVPLSSLTL